jgi:hypothetical protein
LGIDYTALQALAYARKSGVNFSKTVLLGHQELHVAPHDLIRIFKQFQIPHSPRDIDHIADSRYADNLFRFLGAAEIDSIDAAEYEEASIIHDMNAPVEPGLYAKYTLVVDGGTLEHIFNFPVASSNVIRMTAVGGHILSLVPANNLCGHGFYQFSPELFFRVFGPPNGCRVVSMFMADSAPHRAWHRVTDPHVLRRRVNLHHFYATTLIMLATRDSEHFAPGFIPQQSDYEHGAWASAADARPAGSVARMKVFARNLLPMAVWSRFKAIRDLLTHTGYLDGYDRVAPESAAPGDREPASANQAVRTKNPSI